MSLHPNTLPRVLAALTAALHVPALPDSVGSCCACQLCWGSP